MEETAVHEACHAVMAFVMNIRFVEVSIVPSEGQLGFLLPRKIACWERRGTADDVLLLLAGGIGARLARSRAGPWSRYDDGDAHDRERAERMVAAWTHSSTEASHYLAWVKARGGSMVAHPEFQRLVDALVPELFARKRLSELQARRLLWRACRSRDSRRWPLVIGGGPQHLRPHPWLFVREKARHLRSKFHLWRRRLRRRLRSVARREHVRR
ncbi:MAG TPA: hypothetical protein VNN79_05395 [Actinomycetota bacterium]|nr:hypothetical protein [Actinomycetota bacterium]